jgi:lysozyme family protein
MSYEPSFNDAVEFTLRKEGVLNNNPNDSGGLTKFGITQKTLDAFAKAHEQKSFSVSQLTVEGAIEIYYAEYWRAPKIDQLPRELQGPVFDFVVNSGGTAVKQLQAILGVAQDGDIGPVTLAKLVDMQPQALRRLRNSYITARLVFLADLVQHQPKDVVFIEGWVRRVTSLYDFAY